MSSEAKISKSVRRELKRKALSQTLERHGFKASSEDTSDQYDSASDEFNSADEAEFAQALAAKDVEAWQDGFSASDNDSDGDQPSWSRGPDICTTEELVLRRKERLERLRTLYGEQYQTMRRALGDAHRKYLRKRGEAMAAHPEPETTSRIPPSKRKQVALEDIPGGIDVEDFSNSALHKYQRPRGIQAALRIQKRRKTETGSGYSSVGTGATNPNARVRCAFHPAHLPPCAHRVLPFSKYCTAHILMDKSQELYKRCQHKNKRGVQCEAPVLKFDSPTVCPEHLAFSDFTRNPRLFGVKVASPKRERAFSFSDSMGSSAGYELVAAALGTQLAASALGDTIDGDVDRNLALKELGDVMDTDAAFGTPQPKPKLLRPAPTMDPVLVDVVVSTITKATPHQPPADDVAVAGQTSADQTKPASATDTQDATEAKAPDTRPAESAVESTTDQAPSMAEAVKPDDQATGQTPTDKPVATTSIAPEAGEAPSKNTASADDASPTTEVRAADASKEKSAETTEAAMETVSS